MKKPIGPMIYVVTKGAGSQYGPIWMLIIFIVLMVSMTISILSRI